MQPHALLASLTLSAAALAVPLTTGDGDSDTWTLAVEGTSPGSGEVHDTDKFQPLPGFNHMLRNQSAEAATQPANGSGSDDDDNLDPSLGITLEGVCKHMVLAGEGKIGETTLEAECIDEYAYWWNTTLNLNECITNVDGQLAYMEG